MHKSKVITIGVPVDVYSAVDRKYIKGGVISGLLKYKDSLQLPDKPDKIVTVPVRLSENYVLLIKSFAKAKELTILDFTSRLFMLD